MPILIADSNFLQKPALRSYLSQSKSNRIALAEEVLVEMHKRDPAYTIGKCLEIARGFPKQVVVLRSMAWHYGTPICSAADARGLIDQRQTKNFVNWYDDVVRSESDQMSVEILAGAQQRAQREIDQIANSVKNLQPIFQKNKEQISFG